MEIKDFAATQDGAFQASVDGTPTRFVKESDLLAVKGGAEETAKKWDADKAKVTELTNSAETIRQQLLQAQTSHATELEKYKDYDTHKNRVGELEKEALAHKEHLTKAETELAGRIKSQLLSVGAKEDALKDKTLDQLRNLEEASKIFANQGKKPQYERGNGGGGEPPVNALDRARAIIEAQEKKQGIVRVSSAALAK